MQTGVEYVDGHCHLHQVSDEDLERTFELPIIICAVSEDLESSRKTIELAKRFPGRVVPFVGIHPWKAPEVDPRVVDELEPLVKEAKKYGGGLGEIGVDSKHAPDPAKQIEIFKRQLELAASYRVPANIHAYGLWRIALKMVIEEDVRALFHWYSGPIDLIRDIKDAECFIGVNVCGTFAARHHVIIEHAPLDIIITETDSPYTYYGLKLRPWFIKPFVTKLARARGVPEEQLKRQIIKNFEKYIGRSVKSLLARR